MTYRIEETINMSEDNILGEYTSLDEANKKFKDTVTAFLEGESEEPEAVFENSDYFAFDYQNGDCYELHILIVP